ncbi:putative dihydrodipicolinate synthase/ N-acetylneuraminate lyase [Mesorhizobium sp. SOD10]|nr:putative dihydrodipicolinate synthase/ N-acetylneuraminate lyase [Mesorhizobium sp. SOD10]
MTDFGVIAAMVTPFTKNDTVDEAALRALVDRLISEGVHGLLPSGGTGEFTALSDDERRQVIRIVTEQAAGRVPVVAHTGAASTNAARSLTEFAAEAGATSALLAVPFYETVNEQEAIRYYKEVGASTKLPLIAYNHPPATGFTMTPDFLLELVAEVPTVKAVKDSSSDIRHMHALTARHQDRIAFLTGVDMLFGPALACGAKGAIMGSTNILTPLFVRMWNAAKEGNAAELNKLWQKTLPVATFIETYPYTASVKAGCEILGHPVGTVRSPFAPLEADACKLLEKMLKAAYA